MDLEYLAFLENMLTENRKERFEQVLAHRSNHFTVVIEDVFQLHNTSAVMRSCEVFGIQQLNVIEEFVLPNRVWELLEEFKPDYVMDCIDSVTPKLEWIIACKRLKIKIITHLGAGGKTDPSKVKVTKLENTHNCKLGSHIKKRMKRKDISLRGIKAVFSEELQRKEALKMTDGSNFKKSFYGTCSYMPALFGLLGAAEVIRYLTEE